MNARTIRESSIFDESVSLDEVQYFISGPISWSFYFVVFDDGTSKKFHFFGDKHFGRSDNCESLGDKFKCSSVSSPSRSKYCYDIVYFLENVFEKAEKSNTVVDLFLEVPYLRSSEEKIIYKSRDVGYLQDVQEHFSDCFSYEKTNCKFKNTRFHYVDIRSTTKFFSNEKQSFFVVLVHNPLLELKSILENTKKLLSESFTEAQLDSRIQSYFQIISKNIKFLFDDGFIYKTFDLFLEPGFMNNIEKFLNTYEKRVGVSLVEKYSLVDSIVAAFGKRYPKKTSSYESIIYVQISELQKDNIFINGKNIAFLIKDFLVEKFRMIIKENIKILKDFWENFIFVFEKGGDLGFSINFLNVSMSDFDEFFNLLNYLFMDAYTLPRMFRKYSSKNEKSSSYSITFAGDLHIQTYQEFFESYLLSLPVVNKEGNPERCIYDKNMELYTDINLAMKDIPKKLPPRAFTIKRKPSSSTKSSKYQKSLKTEEELSSSEEES